MIKILIADDHPIVRRGLRELIEDEADMIVECEASSSDDTIENLRLSKIDIVLLDISMPGKSGLDLLQDLKNEFPEIRILVLSALAEEIYAKRALKSGAHGFINKESAPEELIKAIRKVFSGKKYVSPQLAEILVDDLSAGSERFLHDKLSDREFEVLRMIGSGKSVGDIAKHLNLSITTISTYRTRILEKMGLKNNSEIIRYCVNEKLLNDQ